jgi:hypothetical protein
MDLSNDEQLAGLLEEAAETHHHVYRITQGADDDWASWYADWLLDLSELPQMLAVRPVRSHLVHALVQFDRDLRVQRVEGSMADRTMPDGYVNSSVLRRQQIRL